MKKFLVAGVLALTLAALSSQPAAAWWKFQVSYGVNIKAASGNNSLLWGLWYNGQVPGYPGHYPLVGAIYPSAPHHPAVHFGGYEHLGYDGGFVYPHGYEIAPTDSHAAGSAQERANGQPTQTIDPYYYNHLNFYQGGYYPTGYWYGR